MTEEKPRPRWKRVSGRDVAMVLCLVLGLAYVIGVVL